MEEELMMYEIIDVDDGFVYELQIPKSMEAVYNMDHVERHRLLKMLKDKNVKPVASWDVSLAAQERTDEAAGSSSLSMWVPEPAKKPVGRKREPPKPPTRPVTASGRATGKKGAKWGEKNTTAMLNTCLPFRKWLRLDVIAPSTWQDISDKLYERDPPLDYSWEQIRERIRNLKRTFKNAKLGLNGGTQWDHYWLMVYIYDEEIVPGNVTLAPSTSVTSDVQSGMVDVPTADDQCSMFMTTPPRVAESPEEPTVAEHPGSNLEVLDASHLDFLNETGIGGLSIHQFKPSSPIMLPSPVFSSTMITVDDHEASNAGAGASNEGPEVDAMAELGHNSAVRPTWVVMSPAKKRSKNIESHARVRMQSPTVKKTTPRKVPKIKLVWQKEVTEEFVKLCVAKKSELRGERIPLKIWKEIAETLNNPNVNWQTCRDKYDIMKQFFLDTLIPLEGIMAGMKWPHYDDFCSIFDVPNDVYSMLVSSEEENQELREWDDAATKILIGCYKGKQHLFESNKIALRHNFLFSLIAQEVQECGYRCDYKKCKLEWNLLVDMLRREHDRTKGTGQGPSTWPLFEDMMQIFHKSATLDPPFGVSVGTGGLKYSQSGEESRPRNNTSRSRSSASSKASSAASCSSEEGVRKGAKKAVFKSWAQELKEELQQRTDVLTEFRLMRQFFEKRDEKRDVQWQSMTEAIKYSADRKE